MSNHSSPHSENPNLPPSLENLSADSLKSIDPAFDLALDRLVQKYETAEREGDLPTMRYLDGLLRRLRISTAMNVKATIECYAAAGFKVPQNVRALADRIGEDGSFLDEDLAIGN